jgi:hypothetical protein
MLSSVPSQAGPRKILLVFPPLGGGNNCEIGCSSQSDCGGNYCANLDLGPGQGTCMFVRPAPAGCPLMGCACVMAMDGKWVQISSSSGKQTVSYQQGVKHSSSSTNSSTWGKSATAKRRGRLQRLGRQRQVQRLWYNLQDRRHQQHGHLRAIHHHHLHLRL